jgi:two-component system, NarL family, sensor kinase
MENQSDALQGRNRELSILNTIAQALNREVDLTQALRTALRSVAEIFGLRTSWIWLFNEQTGAPYLAASQQLPHALSAFPARMEGSCYCLDTYLTDDQASATNINIITCSRLKGLVDGTDGLRSHASIPLDAQGRRLGVLNVASADWRALAADDLQLLTTIGDMLAIAIERARLFDQRAELGALEERNRLAREIHDTLAQGLTAVALQLETADALLELGADPRRARAAVQQALALTRVNLEDARRSVLGLRAAQLQGKTLAEALPALVEQLKETARTTVDYQVTGGDHPLPTRVAVGLYRIAQEALTNIARHARAGHVVLQLTVTAERAELRVEDDGCGFDPAQVPDGHFGLLGLRERARLLGGTLALWSSPAIGTKILVRIPLEAAR